MLKTYCFLLYSLSLQPCWSLQLSNTIQCECVHAHARVWIPLYCLASHPVCCSVECGAAAYCTRQMSLRCHFAARLLLIFLTLRSEQSPPHSSLHPLSYLLSPQYSLMLKHKTDPFACIIQPRDKPETIWKYSFPYPVLEHNAVGAYTALSSNGSTGLATPLWHTHCKKCVCVCVCVCVCG